MRVDDLLVTLVQSEGRTEGEQHQRDDERVEVAAAAIPELVQRIGFLVRFPLAPQQQALIGGIGHGVHRLREHRRTAGDHEADELGDCDPGVRQQGSDDGALAT